MKASFRFSPRILARLGEELNQSLDQSVLELVKNAYDADAKHCRIELHDESVAGGSIVVVDDGDGMSPEQITSGWLVLGKSGKESGGTTRLGRHPAGNKGLGRLAALRLGKSVFLSSVSALKRNQKNELSIDWSMFDKANLVEEVSLEINTRKVQGEKGTRIELNNLRSAVSANEVRKLARSLVLLTDPFSDGRRGFNVELLSDEFSEIAALVGRKYFDIADYHLRAFLDGNGYARAEILDWQGNILASADHDVIARSKTDGKFRAPKLAFDLWVFLLGSDNTNFAANKVTKGEVQAWLKHFGGVHVYDKGIRVAPYGNMGDDWLEMNLSRVRSPEERPSTNTSIGRVSIDDSARYKLTQKTDRSGYIEDDVYREVRRFAVNALEWLARWRLKQAEARRQSEKSDAPKQSSRQRQRVEAALASAPPDVASNVRVAFEGYEKRRDKETEILRREIQLYRTLSTAGITAATFAHESQGNPIKLIQMGVTTLRSRIPTLVKEAQRGKLMHPLHDISGAIDSLSVLTTATLSLVSSSKRRVGKVEIHSVISKVDKMFAPFLKGRGAQLVVKLGKGSPYLRASEAALESVFTNLINNSLQAFEVAGSTRRKIFIESVSHQEMATITFSDTGPGIVDLDLEEIWLPGITTNPEGTGLGLTIVRDTVRDLGGRVHVVGKSDSGGAQFQITLPILGV